MKKDKVIGLGEIGLPIYKILSKNSPTEGLDINPILNKEKISLKNYDISFLHFCIPFSWTPSLCLVRESLIQGIV